MLLKNAVFGLIFLFSGFLHASHNLGGEITFKSLGGGNYEVTLTTYTDPTAAQVDRCTATIEVWSGGSNPTHLTGLDMVDIPRSNGPFVDQEYPTALICDPGIRMGEYIYVSNPFKVKVNIYRDTLFLNPGSYNFYYYDPARYDNVVNIPNAGTVNFTVWTSLIVNPILANNQSVQFLNHALDFACTNRIWTHNPGGWDPDGDSLSYSLVPCAQMGGSIPTPVPVFNYSYPDAFGGVMTIDNESGLVTWNTPQQQGVYNIAIKVVQYRNGIAIDSLVREMAIYVFPCDNEPPVIEAVSDTCVQVGDTLVLDIKYWDPNFVDGDSIYAQLNNGNSGNNGPFSVPISPATIVFNPPSATLPVEHDDTVRAQITWIIDCSHIRSQFYQIDLYAHDGFFHGIQMLSTHHVIKIRVKAPPATGLVVTPGSRQVNLQWDVYTCPDIEGYEIYRHIGPSAWQQDSICCDGNPEEAGFTLVGTTSHRDSVTFVDDYENQGFDYGTEICYAVVAVFPDGLRSCATEVQCVQVQKDHAVLTQDSVDITDAAAGSIFVSWSQPSEIDTLFFPRPYTYKLMRADGINGGMLFTQVASGIAFDDTTHTDVGLNTVDLGYRYRVDVYDANDELIAEGNRGSSIYLTITPGDQALQLSWREFVPWQNTMYYIFRADNLSSPFVLIDSVAGTGAHQHFYLNTGLVNFEDYCYYVLGKGEYPTPDIKKPLWNASQKVCESPRDFTPPCIDAANFDSSSSCTAMTVELDFLGLDPLCGGDLDYYTIWFSDLPGGPWTAIDTVDSGSTVWFLAGLESIADCYGISATDSNGNQSEIVQFCFDNCPEFEPSNVFTPNGDGINDFFDPFRDRAVKVDNIFVYDRWGSMVYVQDNVTDIHRLWDGTTNKGKAAPEGVYYYVINYSEIRLVGDFPRPPLAGHVTLLR